MRVGPRRPDLGVTLKQNPLASGEQGAERAPDHDLPLLERQVELRAEGLDPSPYGCRASAISSSETSRSAARS
jgi:hypothetical protein